jgi:hypothetical protein
MSENIKMEDLIEEDVTSTSEEKEEVIEEPEKEPEITPEQDPLKIELERVKTSKYTEKEKAEFTLRKNAERVKSLGGDPNSILGIEEEPSEDDDEPMTVGMYKKIQQESAVKSALQLAGDIQNETERELVIFHLNNSIRSTGIPSEDLRLARALVNAVKNAQIGEEIARKTQAKTHSNSSGVNAVDKEVKGELTEQEKLFLGKPFSMTKEQILKARTK